MSTRVKVIFWFTWVQCFHSLLNMKHLMFFSVKFSFCLFIQLTQITRTGQSTWESKNILAVSFAPLVQQSRADGEKPDTVHLRKFPRLIKQTNKKKNPPSFCVSLSLTHLEMQSRQYFKFNAWCVESWLWHMKLAPRPLPRPSYSSPWNTETLFSFTSSLVYADLVEGLVRLYGLFLFVWRTALKHRVISLCPQPQWLSAAFRISLGSTYAALSETWPTRTARERGRRRESPRSANAGAVAGDASTLTFL